MTRTRSRVRDAPSRTHRDAFLAALAALALSAAPLAGGDERCAVGEAGRTQVREVFDAYKRALVEGDGARAAELIDASTFDDFERLRRLALEGDEESVRSRPFVDRLLVVSMRHVLSAAELHSLTFQQLIETAFTQGWVQPSTVSGLEMGEPTIEGEVAVAEPVRAAQSAAEAPEPPATTPPAELRYRFVCEQGAWRFQFGSLVQQLNSLVSELTAQLGTEEDALIFALVEAFSGRKVLPEVWSRPADEVSPEPPPHPR